MGRPVSITKALAAAVANSIATVQTLGAGAKVNINGAAASGGVATLDVQRRIGILSSGNDSGLTWTVIGTNGDGAQIRDSFAGATATNTAQSNLDFKTVTQITASGAASANVTVGTTAVGSTQWVRVNPHLSPTEVSIDAQLLTALSGDTANIEYTYDEFLTDPGVQSSVIYGGATPNPNALQLLTAITGANDQMPITVPCLGWRLTITAGTGTWKITGTQAGISGP